MKKFLMYGLLSLFMFAFQSSAVAAEFYWQNSRITSADGQARSTFSLSAGVIYHWIYLGNVRIGDVFEWKYYRPVLDQKTSQPTGEQVLLYNTPQTLTRFSGAWVFSGGTTFPGSTGEYASGNWTSGISSYNVGLYPGPWKGEIYRNGALLVTKNFQTVDDIEPVVNLYPYYGTPPEGAQPIRYSVGDNFRIHSILISATHVDTGEKSVLLDDNLGAVGTSYIYKTFFWDTASVLPGDYLIEVSAEDPFGNRHSKTKTIKVESDRDGDGYSVADGDCDDNLVTGVNVHPGAEEVCGDNIDNNCDGVVDEGCCDLTVESFTGAESEVNRDTGGNVLFNAMISDSSDKVVDWDLNVAGRSVSGAGKSPSIIWDGKRTDGKVVEVGSHSAVLNAGQVDNSDCTDSKELAFTVAENANSSCMLKVTFGSTANVAGGELSDSLPLFPIPGTSGLAMSLNYRSQDSYVGTLGTGWRHSLDITLTENTFGEVILNQGNGRYLLYRPIGAGTYRSQAGDYAALSRNPDGGWDRLLKSGVEQRFNVDGQLVAQIDRNGNQHTFSYVEGLLQSVTDAAGRTVSFAYDGLGKLSLVTDPAGNTYTFLVDETLQSVTFPDGATWQYSYAANAFLTSKVDPLGNLTSYSYDDAYRVRTAIDPEGRSRTINYPQDDDVVRTTTFTEKDGGEWQYTYDPQTGDLLEKTDVAGNVTSYTYDANHNMTSKAEPGDKITSYGYDSSGNMTSVTDVEGKTTEYTYNEFGQVLTISEDDGSVTSYSYDERGNLTGIESPAGISSFEYDESGQLIRTIAPGAVTTVFGYDAQGNLTAVTGPDNQTTHYRYDDAGNRIQIIDAEGNVTRFEYDARGRVSRMIDSAGKMTEYAYDAAGNRSEIVDANGNITRFEYNAQGQMVKMIDALGNATVFEYSGSAGCSSCSGGVDQLTALTDAKNQTTRFGYNPLGQMVKEVDPLGRETRYDYDVAGRVDRKTDANGNSIDYDYDVAGRLVAKTYPDGNLTTFAYDSRGNLQGATNQDIAYTFTYDSADRMIKVADSRGYELNYTYDSAGRRSALDGSFNIDNDYDYDTAGRLAHIRSMAGDFSFAYDDLGRRSRLTYPNGVETAYDYDDLGRLTSLVASSRHNLIAQSLYTHDPVGNRTSKTDSDSTLGYIYDATYRLTGVHSVKNKENPHDYRDDDKKDHDKSRNDKKHQVETKHTDNTKQNEYYQYDVVGNRITSSQHRNYTHDTGNELLTADRANYSYDANGNRTKQTTSKGNTTYIWNYENQLTQVILPDGGTVSYAYDPFGRRIAKISSENHHDKSDDDDDDYDSKVTRYLYDGEDIVAEINDHGKVGNRYVHGPGIDEPLALIGKKKTAYYHADGLGSIVAMTDDRAKVVQSYEYDSYGNLHDLKNSIKQPYTYTGREYDRETGLYYYRARYYDSDVGRFISEDPLGFLAGDVNLYGYVWNRPIAFIDPLGLDTLGIHSNVAPNADFTDGHAWVSYRDANGNITNYGLWPDNHPRTVNNGAGTDVRIGLENGMSAPYSRYYDLSPEQIKRFVDFVNRTDEWQYSHTCADWASDTVRSTVGENVDADDWLGFETPRELSESIEALERNSQTSPMMPLIYNRGSRFEGTL
jgi:RHS repeat-associated protein